MDNIEKAIRSLNMIETEYRPEESTNTYSFDEIRGCIINELRSLGAEYFVRLSFPRLLRVQRRSTLGKVAEFTPCYIKYFESSFKDKLLQNQELCKYKEYIIGEKKLDD